MKNRTVSVRRSIYLRRILPAALLICAAALLHDAVRAPALPERGAPPAASVRLISPVPAAHTERDAPLAAVRTRRAHCYNILLSGIDASGGGSDTNLLVRFDVPARRIDAVSLPRDTLLHHAWYSNKLNYAYASGGSELLRSEIENLLGVPVDYCVSVHLSGFIDLIDRIGGIDFDIPVDMDYDDPAQGLHIHYTKGPHHLNGRQAMEVVRWRKNNNGVGYADADIGRIRTQQAFLRSAAAQAARCANTAILCDSPADCFDDMQKSGCFLNHCAYQ